MRDQGENDPAGSRARNAADVHVDTISRGPPISITVGDPQDPAEQTWLRQESAEASWRNRLINNAEVVAEFVLRRWQKAERGAYRRRRLFNGGPRDDRHVPTGSLHATCKLSTLVATSATSGLSLLFHAVRFLSSPSVSPLVPPSPAPALDSFCSALGSDSGEEESLQLHWPSLLVGIIVGLLV